MMSVILTSGVANPVSLKVTLLLWANTDGVAPFSQFMEVKSQLLAVPSPFHVNVPPAPPTDRVVAVLPTFKVTPEYAEASLHVPGPARLGYVNKVSIPGESGPAR